ncbi:MAG TPA: methyltransferase domain-containing protein [Candidatus Kapabacteria bacterium]
MNATLKHRLAQRVLPLLRFNRRTFDILRYEVNAIWLQVKNRINPRYYWRKSKVRKQTGLLVNFGSGGRGLEGWINTDIGCHRDTYFQLDIRRPLPFAAGSVKFAFVEHVLEHLDFRDDVPKFLAEVNRILEMNGVIRIVVPNAQRYLEAYVANKPDVWNALGWDLANMPDDILTPMHIVNHVFHQSGEHLFAYDFETLKLVLEKSGFRRVLNQNFRVSLHPKLAIDQVNHRLYSLYVEAMKG